MRNKFFTSLLFIFSLFLSCHFALISARPGGGGGGGGRAGGGGARAGGGGSLGHSIQRSPSMSRARVPSARAPNRTMNAGASQFQRPTQNQIQGQLQGHLSGAQNGNFASNGRVNQRDLGNSVRNQVGRNNPNRNNWFNNNAFDRAGFHTPYYGEGANWWAGATALGAGSWLGWEGAPSYYDYSGDTFAIANSEPVQSMPAQYPAQEIAEAAPAPTGNWLPLGVFALVKNSESAISANTFFQLALAKDGQISGAVYNSTTGQSYEVEGVADQKRLTATWKMAHSENSPFIETGLYNLTEDQAPARIYYANGITENVLLVRIQENR